MQAVVADVSLNFEQDAEGCVDGVASVVDGDLHEDFEMKTSHYHYAAVVGFDNFAVIELLHRRWL